MPPSLSESLKIIPSANCPVNTIFLVGTPPKREDYASDLLFREAYWKSPWCGRIEIKP
jgi:hypothetical protein